MSAPVVVKLGGNAIVAARAVAEGRRGEPLVLVHGGGAQISALMRARGIEPRFEGGRRVTDAATLACAVEALGCVSDELAATLVAIGLTPTQVRDGMRLAARQVGDLGLVGEIDAVDDTAFAADLAAGRIPLVAPLGRTPDGRLLNVNADDVAAAVAVALGAGELAFVSDVDGVLDPAGHVLGTVSVAAPPPVAGGMLPKLEACARALEAGVGRVTIGPGTVVVP